MNQQYKGPLDYVDVATRIVDFRKKYPEGCLRQKEVEFLDFAGKSWVVYTAEAWRTPDDPAPAHGTAWEPVPGPTNFTKNSELQNAETAAWGRAIVAALAADTKHGVASSEEVRNRMAEREEQNRPINGKERQALAAEIEKAITLDELRPLWHKVVRADLKDLYKQRGEYIKELERRGGDRVETVTPEVVDDGTA